MYPQSLSEKDHKRGPAVWGNASIYSHLCFWRCRICQHAVVAWHLFLCHLVKNCQGYFLYSDSLAGSVRHDPAGSVYVHIDGAFGGDDHAHLLRDPAKKHLSDRKC